MKTTKTLAYCLIVVKCVSEKLIWIGTGLKERTLLAVFLYVSACEVNMCYFVLPLCPSQTSDTVSLSEDTERLMQVSKTVKQKLPAGSQALIQWAEENEFKPVTSYTNSPVANHFKVRLREQGKSSNWRYEQLKLQMVTLHLSININCNKCTFK